MPKNDWVSKYIQPIFPVPTSLNPTGTLDEKIRSILFDLYGTLFISGSGDISTARRAADQPQNLEKLFHRFGIKKSLPSVLKQFFNAIDEEHRIRKEKGIDFPEVEIDQIWMHVLENQDLDTVRDFAMEFELIVNPVYPMPNLEKTLSTCRELNIRMGIISNAQFYTPFLFRWFLNSNPEEVGFHPDLLFFSYKFGYAKPSLFMFETAVERLKAMNISAHRTLYVGNDMLNDIYPAKRVGLKTALFAGDARSLRSRKNVPECKHLSADIIVTDLLQLLNHIPNPGTGDA